MVYNFTVIYEYHNNLFKLFFQGPSSFCIHKKGAPTVINIETINSFSIHQ